MITAVVTWPGGRLENPQAAQLEAWFPGVMLLQDLSWGPTTTVVLLVADVDGNRLVVKAGRPSNHHIGREITAHESATGPLLLARRVSRLVHADRSLRLLVTTYLDGTLVQGSATEWDPDTYQQAGAVLRDLHAQAGHLDDEYDALVTSKVLALLDRPHRIDAVVDSTARQRLMDHRPLPQLLVPTHGDWQPRNWLMHDGRLRVIDFGRFDFRPAATDLCRLAAQQWRGRPDLRDAFFAGYGTDPRERSTWPMMMLREALATTVWAYQEKDEAFEEQGHRMIDDALALF